METLAPDEFPTLEAAAVSGNDIWVAGYTYSGKRDAAFIQRWDGNTWSIEARRNDTDRKAMLRDIVAATGASGSTPEVWAAGTQTTVGGPSALVLRRKNGVWVDSDLFRKKRSSEYRSITADGDEVWAAGSWTNRSGASRALIRRFNGRTWSNQTLPNPRHVAILHAVDASSPTNVWAVGTHTAWGRPYALHFNGKAWSKTHVPQYRNASLSRLVGVTAIARNDVWAVGYKQEDEGGYSPLAMHWNGEDWKRVSVPSEIGNVLEDVDSIDSDQVWAAVREYHREGEFYIYERPRIIAWDGDSWNPETVPDVWEEEEEAFVQGIAVNEDPTDPKLFAVGDDRRPEPLVLERTRNSC